MREFRTAADRGAYTSCFILAALIGGYFLRVWVGG